MTKAYSYIRFSSKRQASGDSLRRQSEAVSKYCLENGLELSKESFEDLGVSAWNGANTNEDSGLSRFLRACDEGVIVKGSYLLVESLDRLSRASVETAQMQLLQIISKGVIVVTLIDNKVYQTGSPSLMVDLIISLTIMQRAHEESETKSKRIAATWANKRANPYTTTRTAKCPFWLELNDDKRTYTVLDDYKKIVEKVFELAIDGFGMIRIAKALNEEGFKTVTGKAFQEGTISAILNGKQVLGIYQPHKREGNKRVGLRDEIPDYYPAIIDEKTYYLAQARLQERKKSGTKGRQGSNENVFLNTATCSKCGANLVLTNKETSWLMCKNRLVKECDNSPVRLDVMQRWLTEAFLQPAFSSAFVNVNRVDNTEEVEALKAKVKEEENALQGLLAATKDFSNSAITQELQRRSGLITELSNSISELESNKVVYDEISSALQETTKLVKSATSKGVSPEQLKDRLQLRRLLQNRLHPFEVGHFDQVVKIDVTVIDGASMTYRTPKGSTKALKQVNSGELSQLWSVEVHSTFIDKYKRKEG